MGRKGVVFLGIRMLTDHCHSQASDQKYCPISHCHLCKVQFTSSRQGWKRDSERKINITVLDGAFVITHDSRLNSQLHNTSIGYYSYRGPASNSFLISTFVLVMDEGTSPYKYQTAFYSL
jgi:hypothetical protein